MISFVLFTCIGIIKKGYNKITILKTSYKVLSYKIQVPREHESCSVSLSFRIKRKIKFIFMGLLYLILNNWLFIIRVFLW